MSFCPVPQVSIETFQPDAKTVLGPPTLAESGDDDQGMRDLVGGNLSREALAFCRLTGVVSELRLAIETARNCFQIIGKPDVELVHDPETDDASYLVIEVKVRGEVKDIVVAHRKFALETARLLGAKRAIIALNYDII